jgi:soluble lytic murein transglycosylase-like protein
VRSPRSSRSPYRHFAPLAPVLLVPLLLGSSPSAPTPRGGPAIPGASDRASLAYAQAADAVRRKDCAGAQKTLAPLLAARSSETRFATLVAGFYAHACEQVGLAEEQLYAAADPDGLLEDWRLYILSDSAAARGHTLLAQASLAKLLGDYPSSPLRPRALLKAARSSWQQVDSRRALELIDQARREDIGGPEGQQLAGLGWEIATQTGDDVARRQAAKWLLTDFPPEAARLQVVELFRRPGGNIVFSDFLTAAQLERRAGALLALKLDASALITLDAVALADRDADWALLKASALTRTGRGDEALDLLAATQTTDLRQAAAVEYARAQAATEVASVQRGRKNLPATERALLRQRADQHLRKVVQIGGDPDLSTQALRTLYADAVEDGRFEEGIEFLRQLRRLSPADTTGASHLWQLGWQEYGRRNYTGAIGYWTELSDLYPTDSNGRRGRYWAGRAFEELGETERANQIYTEVAAADTTDFYRKNAVARLRRQPAGPDQREPKPDSWPLDPALTRARLLTDLGLEELALSESELVEAKASPTAVKALEALVLARKGERRKSIQLIRDAFPALGGAFQGTVPEEARHLYYPLDHQDTIRTWASRNRLPTFLVYGIIRQESAFDTNAQSWAGARGLMQLMPATARELAGKLGMTYTHERLSDPAFNVQLGTTYFSQVLDMFSGNQELALAGYNGGPYRIKRLWKEAGDAGDAEIDRFLESLTIEESKTYVKRILVLSDSYKQLYPQAG